MNADDLAARIRQWRTPMLRFALLHLQPREEAEDAVQDTLVALASASASASAQDDPRRYAFGILKNKITDRLRQRYRGGGPAARADVDDLDALLFEQDGHWAPGVAPTAWKTPEQSLHDEHFLAVVEQCVSKLPEKIARVFSMKTLLECEADEICQTLALSKDDYWQCMSRARKQLQLCLTQRWFEGQPR